jgi:fatty acyl-CoA reductase
MYGNNSPIALFQALVFVSTAFSNSEKTVIEEKIYPAPVDPSKLLEVSQWLNASALDALLPR